MVLAELSAPCPTGTSDCLQLQQLRLDRTGRTMLSWRERAPSMAIGSHMGQLSSSGNALRRGQISADADVQFRVLTAGTDRYAALLREFSHWKAMLADFSTAASGAPALSEKAWTLLTDEMVDNFTEIKVGTVTSELNTFAKGATAGTIDLGGFTARIGPLPEFVFDSLKKTPVRGRLVPFPWGFSPGVLWLGTIPQGQGFTIEARLDGNGAYTLAGLLRGDPRAYTSDVPGCRNSSPGFPSVMGGGYKVGWLESNDAGTGCLLQVEMQVISEAYMHVRKAVATDIWAVFEQQQVGDPSAPTLMMVANYSTVASKWTSSRVASEKPMSRLLGQATTSGLPGWIAIAWQDCASTAANAVCTTYVTKSQSVVGWDLKKTVLPMAAGSSAPLVSINEAGDAIVSWVEPKAACTTDATKQCAQLKAQRF